LLRGDRGFNLALAVAPAAIPAYQFVRTRWERASSPASRWGWAAALSAAGLGAVIIVLSQRPGGFDANVVMLVVGNTGDHLYQLVGILGWLNAPVPVTAVLLFWVCIGAITAIALVDRSRSAAAAAAALATIVVVAWALELGQGSSYGDYWQGRYSMPFAVGLPLLAAWGTRSLGGIARLLAVSAWAITNLGFFAAQRRWAVGSAGSWYVWRWDNWDAPVPPVALILLHAGATGALAWIVMRHDTGGNT
jgi:hypothetical protein